MSDVINFKFEEIKIDENISMDVSVEVIIFFSKYQKFYPSTYACPHCKELLHKTNFEVGKEYPIFVNDGKSCIGMKRVFTCRKSQKFFTAVNDKLSDGYIYSYKCKTFKEYTSILDKLNWYGTTKGRPDGGYVELF